MVTIIAGKDPSVYPASTAFSMPIKMMKPTQNLKKKKHLMPHRSNTEFRRVRSSAHRVRGRLSAIQNQIGTKLFKKDVIHNEVANEKAKSSLRRCVDFETFKEILRKHSTLHVTDEEAGQIMKNYEDKKTGTINLEDICFNLNVDLKKFHHFVHIKAKKRQACRSLPLTALIFAAFLAVTFFQSQTKFSFEVHEVVHDALVRSAPFHPQRVSTIPDVWTWIKESLVPATNFQSPNCGKSTGKICIGRSNYVLSNRVLLVQKRARRPDLLVCELAGSSHRRKLSSLYAPKGCPDEDEVEIGLPICGNDHNATCVPKAEWNVSQRWPEDLSTAKMGFERQSIPDYDCTWGFACSTRDQGYSSALDASSHEMLLKHLTYLEDRHWLDASRTTSLEILFVVYNADVGLLVKVRMHFTFYPGGDIDHDLLVDSVLEPLQWGGRDVAYSCLWWLIIIALPLQDMTSAIRCGKGLGTTKILTSRKFWLSPWRFLMYSHVLLMIVMFALWRTVMNMATGFVDASVEGQGDIAQLHQAVDLYFFYRVLAVLGNFMFLLRFFHAFVAFDQLSIIYVTLKNASFSLLNFAVVLSIILAAFVSSSMLIFGNQIENFSTLLEAVAINYHGIVGELDFEALLSVDHIKYLAFVWWILYIFFVVITAFNMILAIVLRTYNESFNGHINARSFGHQIRDEFAVIRAKLKGWITLSTIVRTTKSEIEKDETWISAKDVYECLEFREPAQLSRNPQYARKYVLSLFEEFVIGSDTQTKGHDMRAFARIEELDDNFEHLHTRVDGIASTLKLMMMHLSELNDIATKEQLGKSGANTQINEAEANPDVDKIGSIEAPDESATAKRVNEEKADALFNSAK